MIIKDKFQFVFFVVNLELIINYEIFLLDFILLQKKKNLIDSLIIN